MPREGRQPGGGRKPGGGENLETGGNPEAGDISDQRENAADMADSGDSTECRVCSFFDRNKVP